MRLLLALVLLLVSAWPASAARHGIAAADDLLSASTVDLSAYTKGTWAAWVKTDNNAVIDGKYIINFGYPSNGSFAMVADDATGLSEVLVKDASGTSLYTFPQPTSNVWHHWVVNVDWSLAGANKIPNVWVDGASQTLTNVTATAGAGPFGNLATRLQSVDGASYPQQGSLAEVAFWGGINFSLADAQALYNAGAGVVATSVQNASLKEYWQLCGIAQPEPATTGGITLTLGSVNGPLGIGHPISGTGICTGGVPSIVAASCNQTNVLTAINVSSDGDTVTVPAGTCAWNTLTISNKSISLIGAGITTGTTPGCGGCATQITGGKVFTINTKSTGGTPAGFFRLAGFQFTSDGGGCSGATNDAWSYVQGSSSNIRLDHNTWVSNVGVPCPVLTLNAYSTAFAGVADHNTVTMNGHGVPISIFDVSGDTHGNDAWAAPDNMGDLGLASTFYFENNTLTNNTAYAVTDGWIGSRVVWRYNTLFEMGVGNHGTESALNRGMRLMEVYENDFWMTAVDDGNGGLASSRGGTGVIYNNRIHLRNGHSAILAVMHNYRRDLTEGHPWGPCGAFNATFTQSGGTATATTASSVWNSNAANCGTFPYCEIVVSGTTNYNGTHSITNVVSPTQVNFSVGGSPGSENGAFNTLWDGNADSTGYICVDQPGAGQSNLLTDPLLNADVQPLAPVGNASSPIYCWANTVESGGGSSSADCTSASDTVVVGRDVINGMAKPGYTALTYPHPLAVESSAPSAPRHFFIIRKHR